LGGYSKADFSGFLKIVNVYGSIAVPAFMIMSFLLVDFERLSKDASKIKRRMYRLIMPQVVWTIIYFVIYKLMDLALGTTLISGVDVFFWQLFFGHSINQTAWYQVDLILLTIIFVIIYRFCSSNLRKIVIICITFLSLVLQYSVLLFAMFHNSFFDGLSFTYYISYPLGRFFEMIPYAAMGIGLRKIIMNANRNRSFEYAFVAFLCMIFLFEFDVFIGVPEYGYAGLYKLSMGIVTVLFFYFLFMQISARDFKQGTFLNNMLFFICTCVKEISSVTMGIYFMHRLIGTVIYNTFLSGLLHMRAGSITDCIVIFVISFIVARLFLRTKFKWVKFVFS